MSLLGGCATPVHCLFGVFRHAPAVGIAHAQIELRPGISLLGGLAVPVHRLFGVFRHAPAVGIAHAQIVLRPGISLLGGLAVPEHRLFEIFCHAPAVVIAQAQIELRPGISLLGGGAPLRDLCRGNLRRPDGQRSAPQHQCRRTVHEPLLEHDLALLWV